MYLWARYYVFWCGAMIAARTLPSIFLAFFSGAGVASTPSELDSSMELMRCKILFSELNDSAP
jgi:hypothetical protein